MEQLVYTIDMLVYAHAVDPEILSVHDGRESSVRTYYNDVITKEVRDLLIGFNPYKRPCAKDFIQSHLLLGFLKNRSMPVIELNNYDDIVNQSSRAYKLGVRFHICPETPIDMEPVLQVAISELEDLMNPMEPQLRWVHKVWADVVLRILDAQTYEDPIRNAYELVQYLDSEEAEAQSSRSAGYLYGLSSVRHALESVLPEHTKYSNLELLIKLVNKIREIQSSTNSNISQITESHEFKLACDAVDEV